MKAERMMPGDIPEVAELEARLFSDAWSLDGIRGSLEQANAACFVVREEKQISAYLLGYWAVDECEIARVGVDETKRRRGLATELLMALKAFCQRKTCTRILLDVRESNRGARCFYEACGFQEDGIRKAFYRDPEEAAVLMSLRV
jgi:ribosomal-protein-alanine acetyltransferase